MKHNCLDEIVDLGTAAADLDLAPVSLRAAAGRGTLEARVFGKTWITTTAEVERYRREHLGKRGRPKGSSTKWSEIRRAKGAPEIGSAEDDANRQRFKAELEGSARNG